MFPDERALIRFLSWSPGYVSRHRSYLSRNHPAALRAAVTAYANRTGPRVEAVSAADAAVYKKREEERAKKKFLNTLFGWITAGYKIPGQDTVERAAEQIATGLIYSPYALGRDVYMVGKDVGAAAHGDFSFKRTRRIGREIYEGTKYVVTHPGERPGDLALLVLGAASLGAGAAGNLAAAARLARAGRVAAAAKAVVKPPPPAPRVIRHPTGFSTVAAQSRSTLVRAAQKGSDKALAKLAEQAYKTPRGGVRGVKDRAAKAVGTLAEGALTKRIGRHEKYGRIIRQEAERWKAHEVARIRLSIPKWVAIRAVGEGFNPSERIAYYRRLARQTNSRARRALYAYRILVAKAASGYLRETPNGPVFAATKEGRRLKKIYERLHEVSEDSAKIGLDLKLLTPEEAAGRLDAPVRVMHGAVWREPTPTRLGIPSEKLKIARARVAKLTSEARAAVASAQAAARQAIRAEKRAEKLRAKLEKAHSPETKQWYEKRIAAAVQSAETYKARVARAEARAEKLNDRIARARRQDTRQRYLTQFAAAVQRALAAKQLEIKATARVKKLKAELAKARSPETKRRYEKLIADEIGAAQAARTQHLKWTARAQTLGGAVVRATEEATKLERERIAKMEPTGLVGAEEMIGRGRTRFPYKSLFPVRSTTSSERQQIPFAPRPPGSLTHAFKGKLLESGLYREGLGKLVAEDFLERVEYRDFLNEIARIRAAVKPVPTSKYDIPVNLKPTISREARALLKKHAEEGVLTRQEKKALGDAFAQFVEKVFPKIPDALAVEKGEIAYIDKRLLGGLNEVLAQPGRVLNFVDTLNGAARLFLIFLKPGYIPPNLAGALLTNLLQQGVKVFPNLTQAMYLTLGGLRNERLRRIGVMIDRQMGRGISRSLFPEDPNLLRAFERGASGFMSSFTDVIPRRAAWIHEAKKRGFKTIDDWERLITDRDLRDELITVSTAGRNAAIEFEGMGKIERMYIQRVLFIYPWVRGSTKYAGRFLAEHPVVAYTQQQRSQEAQKEANRLLGMVPSVLEGVVPVKIGGETKLSDPTAFSLFESPVTLGQTGVALLKGRFRAADRPLHFMHPLLQAGLGYLARTSPLTGDPLPARQGFADYMYKSLIQQIPVVRFTERGLLGSAKPPPTAIYQRTPSEERLRFLIGGVAPSTFSREAMRSRALEDRRALLSPERRAIFDHLVFRERMLIAARKAGYLGPKDRLPRPLINAVMLRARRKQAYAAAGLSKLSGLDFQVEAFKQDLRVMHEIWGPGLIQRLTGRTEQDLEHWAEKSATADQIKNVRQQLGEIVFGGATIRQYTDALKRRGFDIELPR